MKILLSAFNCNPDKGSEEGRGWAWAIGLSQMGHEVWVITNTDNQPSIDRALSITQYPNLHFLYHQLAPTSSAWWMLKGDKAGIFIQRSEFEWRLFEWQWGAYQIAKSLCKEVTFDCVHHVTNTCIRRYSFMGFLGIPFILGPLAGGLSTPWSLRKSYRLIYWLVELSRDLANISIQLNPLMHLTFAKALKIYCDSPETQALIPFFYRYKSQILFSMPQTKIPVKAGEHESRQNNIFKILFVGRLQHWKGLHLGLHAFADFHQKMPNSHLTVIGNGPTEKWWKEIAEKLDIQNKVNWISSMDQKELIPAYRQHDVFLFPSLHEMGGNVILEAFSCGLPVICLDIGGPGVMVDQTCGRVIKTSGLSEDQVIQALEDALLELANQPDLRRQLSDGALNRLNQFAWKTVLEAVYSNPKSERGND